MSENNFDENIRKKLESIQPVYSEAAWQKLKRSLPIPWYMSFLRDYGTWMFGGLATVAFLGSQYNNQTIRKENKLLNDKISTITNTPKTKLVTDTVYIRQNDTVFTTRYITRYVKVGDDFVENDKLTTENDDAVKDTNFKNSGKSQKISDNKTVDSKSVLSSKNKNTKGENSEEINKQNTKVATNNNDAETNLTFQPNQQVDKVVAEVSEQKLKTAKVEDISEKEVKEETTKPVVEELIIPESKATLPTDQKPKKLDLSKINARFGIAADYMGKQFNSLGPAVEVFLGERFALNSGILITGKHEFEYRLLKDFNMNTGKKFEDRYKPFIGEKPEKIEDIEIETSSIKLPIYLSYYMPLKSNLSFVFSTGTKLDLSVLETVKFNGQNIDGSIYYNKFENQYKPKIFNSFYYGMGFQYQYKRFAGQVSPYFEFPFRQASYLMPPKRFGVNASLKFSLRK